MAIILHSYFLKKYDLRVKILHQLHERNKNHQIILKFFDIGSDIVHSVPCRNYNESKASIWSLDPDQISKYVISLILWILPIFDPITCYLFCRIFIKIIEIEKYVKNVADFLTIFRGFSNNFSRIFQRYLTDFPCCKLCTYLCISLGSLSPSFCMIGSA